MQPPQPPYGGPPPPPGPYGAPPPPGPYGAPPPYGVPPGPFPPARPPRKSRAPIVVIIVVAVVVLAAGGLGAFVLLRPSGEHGRFDRDPTACSLLTQPQVQAYLPGAAADGNGDPYFCEWSSRAGRLIVGVEVLNGGTAEGTPDRAHEQYQIRRQQANDPGVTISPQSLGDEAFMACKPPDDGERSCEIYVRVSNVVFSVEFESFPEPGARDAGSSVRTLTTAAVQHLRT